METPGETQSASGNSPVCYQSSLIAAVCYGRGAVVGSVGNMMASSVTRLPVPLSWLLMESMNQSGSVVAEMEALTEPRPRSRPEERPIV